jgi:hypothetical protein
MSNYRVKLSGIVALVLLLATSANAKQSNASESEFGPVVRAYLGYLHNEQEVVDDRVSRREISVGYYRRNSNRIRALRQIAVRLARNTHNDYLPELEAVAGDELGLLFEHPPQPGTFRVGEVVRNTFRFLGTIRSGEPFYVFARLDTYEQAEIMEKAAAAAKKTEPSSGIQTGPKPATRSRRVVP